MQRISYGDESPIAAFATTPGNSALTLIRCSGKDSIDLVSSVFYPRKKIMEAPGNTVVHGWILNKKKNEKLKEKKEPECLEKVDEVLISVFRSPKSYTGEDCFDICCHGGFSAGKAVMDVIKSAGFRDALPGEFTFRAFMNGKIDLTRSESVMELVSAKTQEGHRHAVSRLCGALEKEINEIKLLLVKVVSGAEIYLDYSEDEISADADEIAGRLPGKDIVLQMLERLKKLSASWQLERIYQQGVTVVISGSPNAGKSSLFNCLLKEDRSIVTEIPGTTRDWIEAWVSIEGIPVRLVDTAGLRESSDSVEKIGVERSIKIIQEAHLILYLIDSTQGLTEEDYIFIARYSGRPILLLWTKKDIAPPQGLPEVVDNAPVFISSKTGEGIAELYPAIGAVIRAQIPGGEAALNIQTGNSVSLGTERQKKLVDAACCALEEALVLSQTEEPLDLIAPLLRDAVNSLGEITGEVSTADILEEMFSNFCVGK